MQQAIDEAGNIWNVDAQGNPVSYVGNANQQGGGMQIKPADPARQFEAPAAAANLEGQQLTNAERRASLEDRNRGSLPKGYRWGVGPDGQPVAELIPGVPPPGEKSGAPSPASVRAAKQLLSRLQLQNKSFVDNFSGSGVGALGEYNPFSGAVQEFNDYSTQMLPFAKQLSRSPGEGAQSDRDAADYRELLPTNTERDQTNINRMTNLRDTAIEVLRSAGEDVTPYESFNPGEPAAPAPLPPQAAASSLPDARGAMGDNVRVSDNAGVTSAGNGLAREPRLAGVGQEMLAMVQAGRPRDEVVAYGDRRFKEVGFPGLFPEQLRTLDYAVRMRAANPSKPVTNFVTGWENYEMVPSQDSAGAQMMGKAATAEVAGLPVGNTATHFFNAAAGGLPAAMAGDNGADVLAASRRTMPKSALLGDIGGSIAAMVGINKLGGALTQTGSKTTQMVGKGLTAKGGIGGDVAYNTARGGLENGPTGAVVSGVAGAVGNKVGSGLIGGTGKVVRGISNPAVNYLASRGVPMTAGQLLGNRGIVGRTMSKLESLPVIGDSLAARRMDSFNSFNRAAMDDAGAGIGYSPSDGGFAGIEGGLKASGQAIDDATSGVNVQLDDQFQRELADAMARGEALPPDFAQKFALVNQNKVQPGISSGSLAGDDYAEMTRGIKGYRAEHQKAGFEGDYRDALGGVQSALDGAVARGAGPEVLENLGAARTSYRDYKLLQSAAEKGQGGAQSGAPEVFTPAQLQAAVRGSKYAQNGTNAPFYQLTKSGQEVLPSTVPNSGSADRGIAGLLLPATLGGGAVAANQYLDPKLAAPLALLAALSSKGGAKVAQKALTGRGPAARAIGTKIIKQRRKAGLFGASAAGSMVPQLTQ